MRIVHVIDSLGRGGAERVVVTLAREARRQRHQVTIFTLFDDNAFEGELRDAGVPVRSLRLRSLTRFPEAALQLSVACNEIRPEAVHAHLLGATLVVGLARFRSGTRRVVTFHNQGLDVARSRGLRDAAAKMLLTLLVRRFDAVTAVSQPAAESYRRHLRLHTSPQVIENPVDVHALRAMAPSREVAREACGIEVGERLAVCVAKFTLEKDHATLFEALALIPPLSRPTVALLGDGPLRRDLEFKAQHLGLGPYLRWCGEVPHESVVQWLAAADLCVLSSRSEGLPVTLLEARALGVWIVATRVGANDEIVSVPGVGVLVDAGDPQGLATSFVLPARPERPSIEERFLPGTVLRRLLALYNRPPEA